MGQRWSDAVQDLPLLDDFYLRPAIVSVSEAVLARAGAFQRQLDPSGRDTVVVIDWAFARSLRRGREAPVEDIGPGLDMGLARRSDVPAEAIETIDGVTIALQIPPWVYETARERRIDVDSTVLGGLSLK